jgi:uncharacterized protein
MAGKFVLQRSASGKYHFNLQAGNGEIIATSQMYETKASAEKGIESVRANASSATLDDRSEQATAKPHDTAKPQEAMKSHEAPKPQAAPKPRPPAPKPAAPAKP